MADLCKGLRANRNFYVLDATRRALTDSEEMNSSDAIGEARAMELTAFDGKLVTPPGKGAADAGADRFSARWLRSGKAARTYGCIAAAATSQMAQGCSGSGGVNTGDVHPPPRATISASEA